MNYQTLNPTITQRGKLVTPQDPKHIVSLRPAPSPVPAKADTVALIQRLQAHLELEPLLTSFAESADPITAFDGLSYEYDERAIRFRLGRQSRHSCSYRLSIEDHEMGYISFSRRQRFEDHEIQTLEELLCALVYPLRNALKYQQALQNASLDPLTGLLNRSVMDDTISREISLAHRHERPLTLLVLDIDHFKSFNDTHGHVIGDQVLRHVAQQIDAHVRETDLAFRYGGEEFVVALPETCIEGASIVAERLLRRIRKTRLPIDETHKAQVTVSIGLSALRAGDNAISVFERADQAMYKAKHAGRDQVQVS